MHSGKVKIVKEYEASIWRGISKSDRLIFLNETLHFEMETRSLCLLMYIAATESLCTGKTAGVNRFQ